MLYQEDLNRSGMYWSFVVERADIHLGSANNTAIRNHCPFMPDVKRYVEDTISTIINIAIDEYKIRNFAKLKGLLKQIYNELVSSSKIPAIKDIDIMGDYDGIRVLLMFGTGYMVDFRWTEFNDYITAASNWSKVSGPQFIRAAIEDSKVTSVA